MKKTLSFLLALTLLLSIGTVNAFAAAPGIRHNCPTLHNSGRFCSSPRMLHCEVTPCFIDADGNGSCDNRSTFPCSAITENSSICDNDDAHHHSTHGACHSHGHHGGHR